VVSQVIQLILWVVGALLVGLLIWEHRRRNSFYCELFELEEAFEGGLDFSQLAKQILAKVLQKTGAFGGILYWFDETREEFKIKTLQGMPTEQISRITATLRGPQGVLEQALTRTESYIFRSRGVSARANRNAGAAQPAPNGDAILPGLKQQPEREFRLSDFCKSIMVIFLPGQSRARGLMVLFRRDGHFTAGRLRMMRIFATRAAVKLDNARLYQFAKETALENTKLYLNLSKLYKQATLDELTGLYNRNFFMQRSKEEVKKAWRLKQPLALIFIDLDYFKKINDQYGHQVGDQLLLEFGCFLKAQIREYDVPCRFGGEEFVLLLPHTNLANAYHLAERIRERLSGHRFSEPLQQLSVTASFGVNSLSDFPEALARLAEEKVDSSVETLVSGADEALYRAKEAGRNQVKALGLM
jgi:diguanylate cyclase (GGDEF)-like protein